MIGRREISYSEDHWKILKEKRKSAGEVMKVLIETDLQSVVYGSVARGDVNEKSDVDVFILNQIPSYKLEITLEPFGIIEKKIVQATPCHAIKGEIVLSNNTTVSFPLVKMKERELDFYRFGGCLSYIELKDDKRVAGVNKKLQLILPTSKGHKEIPLCELHPSDVAKILNVSIDVVEERIRVLTRRREIGRTGIFLFKQIPLEESFENVLKDVLVKNSAIRRKL